MSVELHLVENDVKGFQTPMETEMDKAVNHFETELTKIRSGRAHTSLIENIEVIAYGQTMQLKGVAVLSAPEPRLLTIQPWDATIIPEIEKALAHASIGGNPVNDGKLIRIQLPEMSIERRDELSKVLGKKQEDAKIAVRNVRKDFHNKLRDAKKDKEISENFHDRLADVLQNITDKYCTKIDQMAQKKKTDLTSV